MTLFSLVVKYAFIRLLLTVAAVYNMKLQQPDVKIVLLHGDLGEEIYIDQPRGHEVKGEKDYAVF